MRKISIGPKTLALLRRPSAMRKLDERAISEVTGGMGKWIGKMRPAKARVTLRVGRNRVIAKPTQSAAHTVRDKARFAPGLKDRAENLITRQESPASVPRLFKKTRAAQVGKELRKGDRAMQAPRKSPSGATVSQSAKKVRAAFSPMTQFAAA